MVKSITAAKKTAFERERWPFYWLTRVVGRYTDRLGAGLKTIDLDISRWRVLMCLAEDETMSTSSIAELAIVKLPTMVKIIQRMESEGLVALATRVSDGRVTEVELTELGLVKREQALAIARRVHDRCFAAIPEADRQQLTGQLRTIFNALD